jgi:hypothetical protein
VVHRFFSTVLSLRMATDVMRSRVNHIGELIGNEDPATRPIEKIALTALIANKTQMRSLLLVRKNSKAKWNTLSKGQKPGR